MNVTDLLDRPIAFQRIFVTITGSINAALMLSQAIYWSRRTKDAEGWFYKSVKDWEDETGLTRHMQEAARKLLVGVMDEKLAGMPATIHFRVSAEKLRTWLLESGKQDCRKPENWMAGKQQTIISTETTSLMTTTDIPQTPAPNGAARENKKLKAGPPTNLDARTIAACVGRKPSTEWNESEVKLFKQIAKRADFREELALIERYYAKNRKREDARTRRSVETLLKFWTTELDKARAWCEKHPLPAERKAPKLMPDTLPEEQLPPPDMESQRSFAINYEARLGRLPAGWKRDREGELQHVGLNGANGCH